MTAQTDNAYTVENYAKQTKRRTIAGGKQRLKNVSCFCSKGKVNANLTQMSFNARKSLTTRKKTSPFSKDFQKNKAIFQLTNPNHMIISDT